MILISHRGNLEGPNPDIENNPERIRQVIQMKFDVEGIVIPFPQRDVHLSYSGEPLNPSA